MFAHRHYEWLARFAGELLNESQIEELVSRLQRDNPRFNKNRFLRAAENVSIEAHKRGLYQMLNQSNR